MDEYEHLTRKELISLVRDLKKNQKRHKPAGSRVRAKFPVFDERERREFESSTYPIRIFDRKTLRFLAVNDAALKLYGYTREEFLNLTPLDTRHPDERVEFFTTLREPTGYLRHRGPRRHVTKSGDIIVVEIITQDIIYNGREARLSLTLDVTERVRMHEIMRRREQEFSALVENAPDIIARFDRDLRYVYVNSAMSAATGIARKALVGKTSRELAMPVYLGSLWEEEIRRVFDSGEECRIEFDCPCQGVMRYFEARAVPEFGRDNAVESVLAISRDITQRKQAELELMRQKKLLDAIIDNLPIGVFIRDAKTSRYVLRNRFIAETTGYPVDDPAGKSVYDLFPKEQADLFCRTDGEVLANGRMVEIPEEEVMARSGGIRLHQVRKVPLFDEKGEPWLIIGLSDDITERKRAEQALRASEEFLRRMIESSRDCIKVLDLEGRLLSMNDAGQRLMEIDDVAPLLSRSWPEFWQGADTEAARNAVAAASRGETGQFEGYCATAKGVPKWWDVLVTPICGADEKPEKLLAISRDITRRRQAEDDIKRSRERLQLALEGARLALWDANAESGEVFLSERWAEMLGEPQRETRTTVKELLQLVHPEDRQRVLDAAVLALKGARPDYAEEHRVRAATGEWRWVLSRGRVTERAANGRAVRMSGTNLDITDRKRAEETRALLAAIAASSNDAIITRRPDRTILSWNAAAERIFGWPAAEAVGQPIDLIVPPERRGALRPTVNRVLKGEPVEPVETTNLRKDGVRINTQVTLSALRDEVGKVIAFASTTRDITQRKRAEELLKRRKEEFESLAENLPDIVVRFDREIRYMYANAALERATGLPREAFLGKTHREAPLPTELAARFDESVREVFETGMSNQVELSFITWDGECFFESRHIPERDARGEVISALCVARDVTQRKRAEDELRRQKKLLDAIIEHLPVGVTVKDARTLRYTMRNRMAGELTGLNSAETLGKRAEDLYPPELAKIIAATDREALAGGAAASFPSVIVGRRTGRIARTVKVPVPDERGCYTHLVNIIEDLTEIERAQIALRRSEERLRQLISTSPAAIFSLSPDAPFATTFISENVTAQVGWQPSDFTENPSFWFDHVHPDDREAAREQVAKLATDGKYTCDYRFQHKDGRWRWMHDEGQIVRDADGTPREGIGTWMDITAKRQEAEERVQRAMRQRDALVREVHHRIKNHLQGIAGLLRQKALLNPAVASLIDATVGQIYSVALAYGLQEDTGSPVTLSQLLESICASVEGLSAVRVNRKWGARGVAPLQLAASEAVPVAVAINELMFNAVKHHAAGGSPQGVDISLAGREDKAEIRIANRGSLPRGFDYATGAGCGTGLELVKTLLGPRGSELSFQAGDGWVETVLTLTEPLVTVRAQEAVA